MKKPVKIFTLDTETYNGLIGDLKRIAIYDGKEVKYGYKFTDIENYLIAYADRGYQVHVYVHNLEFDARKIPEIFSKDRIQWGKSFVIKGKLATISTVNYTIHDSFKLLPMSLNKLSKGFNVEHGKLDLWEEVQERYKGQYKDIVDFLDRCDVDDSLYLEYLGYDVISLYEVLEKLIDLLGIPINDFVKRISTASLSRYLFKKGYKGNDFKNPFNMKTDFQILCSYQWANNLDLEEFIRASYCGGRTEVFTPLLKHKGFHYDINSLYPYVMEYGGIYNNPHYPVGKPTYITKPKLVKQKFDEWQNLRTGLGFINCKVFIPMQDIPPLPCKMGKLCFTCGEVFGTWTYEELQYSIENCGVEILDYYECCHFDTTYPVFKNFVHCFYELKEQASKDKNEALRTFAKLILNVGYGYTGMRRDDKTKLDSYENIEKYDKISFCDAETGYIEVPTDITSEYIQVQVASYVTSRARLVLLDALRHASEKGTVYYCDTDSIVTDHPLPKHLIDDSELGKFKLESEPLSGIFLKPKVYAEVFDRKTEVKFKGVSKETQKDLNYINYKYYLKKLIEQNDESILVEKNKQQLRSIMYMQKKDLDFNYYETRDKVMNLRTIEKRNIDYVNNCTSPHFFKSEEDFQNFSFDVNKNIEFNMS